MEGKNELQLFFKFMFLRCPSGWVRAELDFLGFTTADLSWPLLTSPDPSPIVGTLAVAQGVCWPGVAGQVIPTTTTGMKEQCVWRNNVSEGTMCGLRRSSHLAAKLSQDSQDLLLKEPTKTD